VHLAASNGHKTVREDWLVGVRTETHKKQDSHIKFCKCMQNILTASKAASANDFRESSGGVSTCIKLKKRRACEAQLHTTIWLKNYTNETIA